MYKAACQREQEVLDAVQSGKLEGRWGEELRQHMASCSDCADLALIAGFMQQESELALDEVKVPSASFLWWKSKLRARREAEAKAMQPVWIGERIALAAGAGTLVGVGWWLWPESLAPGGLQDLWQVVQNSTLALGVGTAAICLMGFALYAVFTKE